MLLIKKTTVLVKTGAANPAAAGKGTVSSVCRDDPYKL